MSKADQSAARKQANSQIDRNLANEQGANSQLQGILGTAQGTAAGVLPSITGNYTDIATTGGFGDLATTGGISAADETAIRNQAGSAARSTYQTGSDAAARIARATGGYGLSGAVQEDLARQGSEAAATATENANASIVGLRQQGQIAGTQNRLAATGGLTNIYGMNENQISTTVDQILRNYQQTGTLNNQDISILTNLANQPGVFDKITATIGTLGGAAAGVIGAVAPKGLIGGSS